MKRARFVVVLAVALITVVSMGSSVGANPGKTLLPLYQQGDVLGPHEAIASLSLPVAGGPLRARVGSGEGFQSEARAGPDVRTTNSGGTQSEISMAATGGGQNIVLAYNGGPQGLGITSSQNGGRTFGAEYSAPVPAGSNPCCDPSVAADNGSNFYLIQLYRDDGAGNNCTNSLHISTDGGRTFSNIISSPFSYAPGTTDFPDQPHIGVDRNNTNNLYVTTRHFTSGINCPQTGTGGNVQGEIVCSSNGGTTWSNPFVWPQFTDTAHIGVAPDGRVYVAGMGIGTMMNTTRVILWRSTATTCPGAGNTMNFTGPTVVADNLTFGASGIDREFVQPDVIVDPTNSQRVYVSYSADSATNSGDREVFLARCDYVAAVGACLAPVRINDNPVDGTQQYFVMTCVDPVSNAIYASWTDGRAGNHQIRAATITNNGGTVSTSRQVSDATWPIVNFGGTPDYGDYNENQGACRANHHYAAWTSQVSPPAITPASVDPDVFFSVVNDPPVANADGPYSTSEGTNVTLAGSATDTENDTPFTFEWDLDNNASFETPGQNPSFDDVGQDGSFPVCLRVTDSVGDFDIDCSTVVVTNAVPTFLNLANDSPRHEGDKVTITGTISDAGWEDPLSVSIANAGGGTPGSITVVAEEHVRPDGTLQFSVPVTFGDNGTYTVRLCGHDDDVTTDLGTNCANVSVVFDNVDPSADILGTTTINGQDTILGNTSGPTNLTGRSSDPGSDDLTFHWTFGDGTVATATSLVNAPFADPPFPPGSPSIQPRINIDNQQSHLYGDACLYQLELDVSDDDGGHAEDSAAVVIQGTVDRVRSTGYWHHQYKGDGKIDFTQSELLCFLKIAGFMSTVFNEARNASTLARAEAVLKGSGGSEPVKLDRELLTAWLNFATGSVRLDTTIKLGAGSSASFAAIVAGAETMRLNPSATTEQLKTQRQRLQKINPSVS